MLFDPGFQIQYKIGLIREGCDYSIGSVERDQIDDRLESRVPYSDQFKLDLASQPPSITSGAN